MLRKLNKNIVSPKRQLGAQKKLVGFAERSRLNMLRSLKHIYVQIVNVKTGVILVEVSTLDKELSAKVEYGGIINAAKVAGAAITKRALEKESTKVVFDRASIYHSRVAAMVAAAREAGLKLS